MVKGNKSEWKQRYFTKFSDILNTYEKAFLVGVDNVRSTQMQNIRKSLRGNAEIIMGKNTMMRKVLTGCLEQNPSLEKLMPHIVGNVGFVFTKGDLLDIREQLEENKVQAPAKAGAIAPCDVIIPKMNTGLGPEKTSFFQALSIQTKITKGTIEILNDVHIIQKGNKVGPSEASLLKMLKIYPFKYGFSINQVFDEGSVYSPDVLDITPELILGNFKSAVRDVAAVSLAINHPTMASVPHTLANAFKDLLAVAVATNHRCDQSEQVLDYLEDPSKFAGAKTAAPAASAKSEAKAAAPVEESESEDDDIGMSLFD